MNQTRHRVRAAVNPVSTAVTRWWCHSTLRHMLTGHGPTARQRRLIRHGTPVIRGGTPGVGFASSAQHRAEQMKARARVIDDLLGRADHEMLGQTLAARPQPLRRSSAAAAAFRRRDPLPGLKWLDERFRVEKLWPAPLTR
jgi:hypothetical protein